MNVLKLYISWNTINMDKDYVHRVLFISVVFCPHVKETDTRLISHNIRRYGSVIHISCISGHEFTNTSETQMYTRCEADTQWNATILPCTSEYAEKQRFDSDQCMTDPGYPHLEHKINLTY